MVGYAVPCVIRAEHEPIDEQRRRRGSRGHRAERLAHAAVEAAGNEQRPRFDIRRSNDHTERRGGEDDRQEQA